MKATGLKLALRHVGFFLKKNAPKICTALGVGGFIGTAVITGTAAVKAKDILDMRDEQINNTRAAADDPEISTTPEEAEIIIKEVKKDTAKKLVKTFAPPVVLGAASTALIFGGQGIMGRRAAAALASAYEANEKLHKYRQRVAEQLGAEVDQRLSEGISLSDKDIPEKIQKKLENAKTKTDDIPNEEKCCFLYADETCGPTYGCGTWRDDPEYNRAYLIRTQDKTAPDMLMAKGWLICYDIINGCFGNKGTTKSIKYGWWIDPDTGEIPEIDFGLNDFAHNPGLISFLNGAEPNVWLSFNAKPIPDGMIERIEAKQNFKRHKFAYCN